MSTGPSRTTYVVAQLYFETNFKYEVYSTVTLLYFQCIYVWISDSFYQIKIFCRISVKKID